MKKERIIPELEAIILDRDFYKLLKSSNKSLGTIHSIYSKVINFTNERSIYSIVSPFIDNGPSFLKVKNKDIDFTKLPIKVGEHVFKSGNLIHLSYGLTIRLSEKIMIWDVGFKGRENINKDIIKKNISLFNKRILKEGKPGGTRYFYLNNWLKLDYMPLIIEKELARRIENFLHAIDRDSLSQRELYSLIGFGMGLTPAGDDFLVGFISVLRFVQSAYSKKLMKKITSLIYIDELSTTDISKHILGNALEGKFVESVPRLVNSLLEDDKHRLDISISNIFKIGSSSGLDLSIGIVVALSLLMNNFNMEELEYEKYNC